ncbi:hypothetical protein VaNZ11_007301 [Volvox africanus]|uniref:Mitochondrial carrier protein n=1 Tax=Volvox africanus TaxID=51714 RepID=A0ABQ5S2Z3_9CHLO|nr:hypothetical protein VaNZ11_007301 [Volvox africanus]
MEISSADESSNGASRMISAISAALAGPIAGVCSRLITYPAETIKARLQVQDVAINGFMVYAFQSSSFREDVQRHGTGSWLKVARKEGLRGFYSGFGAVALGSMPANLAYFSGYEVAKAVVPASWGILGDMAVGAGAQLLGGLVFTPVDIIKERMQVAPLMRGVYSYAGPGEAVRDLIRQNGFRGLLKGYWATNAVWLPWNIIFIAIYEGSKRVAAASAASRPCLPADRACGSDAVAAAGEVEMQAAVEDPTATSSSSSSSNDDSTLSLPVLGLCSAGSASLAGILTHPADVVKTRLQVLSASKAHAHTTAWPLACRMWRTEGPKVFFIGLGARILQLAPGTALSWVVFEPVKKYLSSPIN